MCKILLIIFLLAPGPECAMAEDLEVVTVRESILSKNISGSNIDRINLEDLTLEWAFQGKRNNVKKSFIIFAGRLWKGFRRYIQGKTFVRKTFSSGSKLRILNASMSTKKPENLIGPVEFKPISVTEDLTPNYTSPTMSVPEKSEKLSQGINQSTYRPEITSVTGPVEFKPISENEVLTENEVLHSILNSVPENPKNISQGVINPKQNAYHFMRQRWRNLLVSDIYDETQPAIVNYVQSLSEIATNLYHTLDKRANRWYLWKLKLGDSPASDYTTQFLNLYKLTLAYGTRGTAYYRNTTILTSVIDGIDFMVKTRKYDGKKHHGHWWHWLIGVPDTFTKIMIIIHDDLPQTQRNMYVKIVNSYASNPQIVQQLNNINVGAYSSSLAEIVLALGILCEEEDTVKLSTHTVIEILNPNRKGAKSFYPDGSFVHENIPHTGFYGKLLLQSIAQITYITKYTQFEFKPNDIQYIFDIIDRAFIPFIFEGELIAPVCARAISRAPSSTKVGYGSSLLYDLIILSKNAPEATQKNLKEAAKFWMRRNLRYYVTNMRNFNDISILTDLLYDDSINGDELPFHGAKLYASMDRFVQRTPDYMVGLALYSSRISAFDARDHENKRGWHTADGMLYLYNDDEVQFTSIYWPTVDPYRLPGTTVDTMHLFDEMLNTKTFSTEKWVGGVANKNQAVIGMALNKSGLKICGMRLATNLQAKKSWFIVEGQIVALGAGITGNTKESIETIVDNRLLNDKLRYLILTNEGILYDPAATAVSLLKRRQKHLNASWILLHESSNKASIGYYFPSKEKIFAISEQRTGTYLDINEQYMNTDKLTGNYSKLIIDHGKNPVNGTYEYVILPGIYKQELKAYAETNTVTILSNTADIQAVKIRDYNYVGINIWNQLGGEIYGISSDKPVSILKQTKKNEDTYVISDPTQSNVIIRIKIPEFTKVIKMSEGVDYDGNNNVFLVNLKNRFGGSEQFTVLYIFY